MRVNIISAPLQVPEEALKASISAIDEDVLNEAVLERAAATVRKPSPAFALVCACVVPAGLTCFLCLTLPTTRNANRARMMTSCVP